MTSYPSGRCLSEMAYPVALETRHSKQIAGNKAVPFVDGNDLLAHADDAAAATLQRCLVQQFELLDLAAVGIGGSPDFQRVDSVVFLHENIDLLGVGIPIIAQVGAGIGFEQFQHHMVLVEVTTGRAVHQGVAGQPHGEIRTQACVAEPSVHRVQGCID